MTPTWLQNIVNNKWKLLLVVLAIQLILMLVGFNKIIGALDQNGFSNLWDGAKNYYTFLWYVQQPVTDSYLIFTGMNYPYNEYIYYTDNTPIFAVFVRWVHLNVIDLNGHFIAAYNLVLLGNMLISTVVLYCILRRLSLPTYLVVIGTICLVWINPQIMRLSNGHFNLSFAWPLLSVIYGQLWLASYILIGHWRKVLLGSVLLAIAIIFASFCHFYYLPITLLWLACALAVICFYQLYQRKLPWLAVLSGLLVAGIAAAGTIGVLELTDTYLDGRLTLGGGYGHKPWVLTFTDMFAAYPFDKLQFIFQIDHSGYYESNSYWGAGALYGLLILFIWRAWYAYNNREKPIMWLGKSRLMMFAMGFGAVVLMFIGLSEDIQTSEYNSWHNYLNLFGYVRPFYEKITQFRALGRFGWPIFWFVNLFMLWYVAYRRAIIPKVMVGIIVLLLMVDTANMIRFYNIAYRSNAFGEKELNEQRALVPIEDPTKYQAILPIPYFHSSSENYEITIDAETFWGRDACQISLAYRLPLMASLLSRTANYQAINLLGLFQGRGVNEEMLGLMDDRPVLVVLSRRLLDMCATSAELPDGWEIDICSLPLIGRNDTYELYEWYPKMK